MDYEKAKELATDDVRLTNAGYSAGWKSVFHFKTLLEEAGINEKFKTTLDIGCGYGIQSRLIKAVGMVEHCSAIDLYDRASKIDEDFL